MAGESSDKRRANAGSFQPGKSGNPTGKSKRKDSKRFDGWMNDYTGFGIQGRDKTLGSSTGIRFAADIVTAEDAMQFWRGDAIAARIIETLPDEALRQGFELMIGARKAAPATFKPPAPTDPNAAKLPPGARQDDAIDDVELQEDISTHLTQLGVLGALREALCYRRAFGGGAILLGANDYATDLREPLDVSRVRSLDWLTVLEPRELVPMYYYADPRAPKFGQVAIYRLMPYSTGPAADGSMPTPMIDIHESRLLIFNGIRVSRRMNSGSTGSLGWGDSVLSRIISALGDWNDGHHGAAILLSDFGQAVMKVKGLAELISADGQGQFMAKMTSIDIARSLLRCVVLDADGEDFERKSTPMTGYSEALDRLSLRLAACCDMPLTKLMGSSAKGLNATGEGDDNNWDDRVHAERTLVIAPAISRLVEIELAVRGAADVPHSVQFPPLSQPSEKETADTHFVQAQADAIYITNSVVSPEEIALSRFGGAQYSLETKVDFDARADQEAIVAPAVEAKPAPPIDASGPIPPDANKPEGHAPPVEE